MRSDQEQLRARRGAGGAGQDASGSRSHAPRERKAGAPDARSPAGARRPSGPHTLRHAPPVEALDWPHDPSPAAAQGGSKGPIGPGRLEDGHQEDEYRDDDYEDHPFGEGEYGGGECGMEEHGGDGAEDDGYGDEEDAFEEEETESEAARRMVGGWGRGQPASDTSSDVDPGAEDDILRVPPHKWLAHHVALWLHAVGLGQYAAQAAACCVEGPLLLALTEAELAGDLGLQGAHLQAFLDARARITAHFPRAAAKVPPVLKPTAPLQLPAHLHARPRVHAPTYHSQVYLSKPARPAKSSLKARSPHTDGKAPPGSDREEGVQSDRQSAAGESRGGTTVRESRGARESRGDKSVRESRSTVSKYDTELDRMVAEYSREMELWEQENWLQGQVRFSELPLEAKRRVVRRVGAGGRAGPRAPHGPRETTWADPPPAEVQKLRSAMRAFDSAGHMRKFLRRAVHPAIHHVNRRPSSAPAAKGERGPLRAGPPEEDPRRRAQERGWTQIRGGRGESPEQPWQGAAGGVQAVLNNCKRGGARGNTALHWAAGGGSLEALMQAAQLEARAAARGLSRPSGAAPAARHEAGRAPAAPPGQEDVGRGVSARNRARETPLHKAITAGGAGAFPTAAKWLDAVRVLVQHGAEVDAADAAGETPLLRAIAVDGGGAYAARIPELVEVLVREGGADPGLGNAVGESPLHRAVVRIKDPRRARAVIATLVAAGAPAGARNARDETPLHLAASQAAGAALRALLEGPADLHATDRHGMTALHRLVAHNQSLKAGPRAKVLEECVKALLEAGADANARDEAGLTVGKRAAQAGMNKLARFIKGYVCSGLQVVAED